MGRKGTNMKKMVAAGGVATALLLSSLGLMGSVSVVDAVGNGPNPGNGKVQVERLHNYKEMKAFLQQVDERSDKIAVETFGQSVKGRDLFLVKAGNNPDKPTILILTQQHGNEALTTEGALQFIKKLSGNGKEVQQWLNNVNILIVPRLNVDGAEGDVNFDISNYVGGGIATRYNANQVDLNRNHSSRTEPETQNLNENVLRKYNVDYLIDFHHQGTQSTIDGKYVSGSMLYPTTPDITEEVREKAKQLGKVVYDSVEARGFGLLAKYEGGTANTIARNGLAAEYGIATLLFEVRGMTDNEREDYVLGQKGNGYLIKQAMIAMEGAVSAIADGSINKADTSFWDSLPYQELKSGEEESE